MKAILYCKPVAGHRASKMRAALLTPMLLSCGLIAGCQPGADSPVAEAGAKAAPPAPEFQLAGKLESKRLDEASGVMTTPEPPPCPPGTKMLIDGATPASVFRAARVIGVRAACFRVEIHALSC